jgi:hypothetical protein
MVSMAVDSIGSHLLSEMTDVGIPFSVIKGPAVARLHPKGWPRSYSDIDILVSSREFRRAIRFAATRGFTSPDYGLPQWPWFDLVCREGVNVHSTPGGNVDLHHHLPPWVFGSRLEPRHIIERSEQHDLCTKKVNFALPEDLVVISALHALNDLWKGKSGLTSWRDVMVIIRQIGETESRAAFERARLGWFFDLMAGEIATAFPEFGIRVPERSPTLPVNAKVRLLGLGWSKSSRISRHPLAWVFRLPAPNAVAFLTGAILPSPGYIQSHHGTYGNYWRQALLETRAAAQGLDYRTLAPEEESTSR